MGFQMRLVLSMHRHVHLKSLNIFNNYAGTRISMTIFLTITGVFPDGEESTAQDCRQRPGLLRQVERAGEQTQRQVWATLSYWNHK